MPNGVLSGTPVKKTAVKVLSFVFVKTQTGPTLPSMMNAYLVTSCIKAKLARPKSHNL
ncbi:Hypothetical protein Y17_3400 [Pectobacterium wasabiae CFBP 3304]|nr:Hypothetical protein Y17_3400 [Pectobacterium wasabiae CFBP 3304]